MATTKLMTAADLAELTEPGRFELIWGELVEMSPSGHIHGKVANLIAWYLTTFVLEHRLGDVTSADAGYLLAREPDLVYAPDVAFVRADRLPPLDEQSGYLQVAPDLVVEVISPSDRPGQVAAKVNTYLVLGVALLWLVDPVERSVTVYTIEELPRTLGADDTIDGGVVLPGFEVKVAAFFP